MQYGGTRRARLRTVFLWLLCLVRPASAGAGGEQWYKYDYEYSFLQAILCVLFIIFSTLFEEVWHRMHHSTESSYKYSTYNIGIKPVSEAPVSHGDSTASQPVSSAESRGTTIFGTAYDEGSLWARFIRGRAKFQNVMHLSHHKSGHTTFKAKHVRLLEELTHRAAKEFMVLGFLGFSIFSFNQVEGFNLLPTKQGSWRMPVTGSDWLHTAEAVHVKLFIAALCYFFLMNRVVARTVKILERWEHLRIRRGNHLQISAQGLDGFVEPELKLYMLYREYFMMGLCQWQDKRQRAWTSLLRRLFPKHDPVRWTKQEQVKCMKDQMNSGFDHNGFAFSAYLALNVEHGVRDSIEIHRFTWITVVILFSLLTLLHRFAKIGLTVLVPFFVAVAFILLATMRYLIWRRHREIIEIVDSKEGDAEGGKATIEIIDAASAQESVHQRHETHIYMLRALQVTLFVICFVFAHTAADSYKWRYKTWPTLLNVCLFLLLFAALIIMLPEQIPHYLAMMSLPPYVDLQNLKFLFAVIDEQNETSVITHAVGKELREGSKEGVSDPTRSVSMAHRKNALAELQALYQEHQQRLLSMEKRIHMLEEQGVSISPRKPDDDFTAVVAVASGDPAFLPVLPGTLTDGGK